MDNKDYKKFLRSAHFIPLLFFFSGFSALIYQILWQRELFMSFGTNTEAVTVIVSIFMLGLGSGAIIGGIISKYYSRYCIRFFLIIEILIGAYGIISVDLIQFVANNIIADTILSITLRAYSIFIIPTLLMGATLPLLVTYLNQHYKNIGKTVGKLYALNSIGAAFAAFITTNLLLTLFDKKSIIYIAVGVNFLTAIIIYYFYKLNDPNVETSRLDEFQAINNTTKISIAKAAIISLFIGYISLSQEIIWFRALSFSTGGEPETFGLILTAFLLAIGIGALRAENLYHNKNKNLLYFIAYSLSISTLLFYTAFIAMHYLNSVILGSSYVVGYLMVGVCAYYIAPIFPILTHISNNGYEQTKSGFRVSLIYTANIIGSTLGPLITGFVLFDYFTLKQNIIILTFISIMLVLAITAFINNNYKSKILLYLGIIILLIIPENKLFSNFLENIQYVPILNNQSFKYTVENKSGIITVLGDNRGDIIYGGGVYDGKFNINLLTNSNGILRAYMVAALHPNPQKVLIIGLSSGSWTKVFSLYNKIQAIDVIEINPGYRELISRYPEVSSILYDKKIKIHYSDGRQWLKTHFQKFDMIVMNGSFYWRSNSTNLLSKEFFNIMKNHLNSEGVVYLNTTSSDNVVKTIAQVFNHVVRVENFVAASDAPFSLDRETKIENFLQFKNDQGESFCY
ncbi:Spermidine synthase [Rickettsiales bacterium Ac37b]|nr:Spermidine synthase [Rickettsiales bacterium Ac37b]